jgi:hypothetical protein
VSHFYDECIPGILGVEYPVKISGTDAALDAETSREMQQH